MIKEFGKFLLLTLFILVIACVSQSNHAYAVSKSSAKIAINQYNANLNKNQIKAASRGAIIRKLNIDTKSIISFASKYLGAKYAYGGNGPAAFDCSGLTCYVMGAFGINLPRSSREQYSYGMVVSRKELSPGDLVYFATSGGKGISHVGIYIGNSNFIHASANGVCISSLNQSYYNSRFVSATRVVT